MKKYYMILGACLFFTFPIVIGVLVTIPGKVSITNDWIGFFGGYFGGLITFAGVWLTIQHYKSQDIRKAVEEKNINIALLYWNIRSHKRQLDIICRNLSDETPLFLYKIYTDYDYQFYFNKIHYVLDILDSNEIEILIAFYHALATIEEYRLENTVDKNRGVIKAAIHSVLSRDLLDNKGNMVKGFNIEDILLKLKPYADTIKQ